MENPAVWGLITAALWYGCGYLAYRQIKKHMKDPSPDDLLPLHVMSAWAGPLMWGPVLYHRFGGDDAEDARREFDKWMP